MRNLVKKFLALVAGVALFGVSAIAQNPAVFGGAANAWAFAYGVNPKVAALQIDTTSPPTSGAGVATFTVAFGTTTTTDGTVITPLSTSAPITVGTGANAETVTPSAVSCGTPTVYQSCSFTATFTHGHGTGDRIASASAGLEEAAGYEVGQGGGLIYLSPAWFASYGGHTAGLTALVTYKSLSPSIAVLDYSGIPGVFSYSAASGSVYASTTHVIY